MRAARARARVNLAKFRCFFDAFPGAPAGTQLYDYDFLNFTAVVFYCTLLLTWNASKVQFHHTARRVIAHADGHHGHAWILNLVC